ncbi:MAG: hypothetical protein LXA50_15710, partial [Betaproteobacteria bacterium]|nr:hypothetical protein [Betaproteobacteria bacterium]
IAIARAKPGQLSGGSSGTGGSSHLALELFKMLSGTDILHVPYKGAAQGMKGYDVNIWFGISAPAGTPRPVMLRIARDLHAAVASADVKERFAGLGLEPPVGTPEAFDRIIREDIERWSKVVKAAKLAP